MSKGLGRVRWRGRTRSLPLCEPGHLPLSPFSQWVLWFSAFRVRSITPSYFRSSGLQTEDHGTSRPPLVTWADSHNEPPLMCVHMHFLFVLFLWRNLTTKGSTHIFLKGMATTTVVAAMVFSGSRDRKGHRTSPGRKSLPRAKGKKEIHQGREEKKWSSRAGEARRVSGLVRK